MKAFARWRIDLLIVMLLATIAAQGTTLFVGTLSYDTFIPADGADPGVYAFDISNLTGGFDLPPDFPVADNLTFQGASLVLNGPSLQTFNLGNIGPGTLVDGDGNPVVQVPGDLIFTSAEFTATLTPTTFLLFDGTTFVANSALLDIFLLPSSGPNLAVDVDLTTINVSDAQGIPEPSSAALYTIGSIFLYVASRAGRRILEDS